MQQPNLSWYVYILKCGDGSYYTGCTTDLERRVAQHNAGTGAKYTRSHLPVKLVYSEMCVDRSTALKREVALKKLRHGEKVGMVGAKE
jgi:putative endonuclease